MRLVRHITLVMRAAHSSLVNTAVSLEPRHFGTLSRSGSNLSQQNSEGGYGSRVRYLKKRRLIWLCKQFRNSLVSSPAPLLLGNCQTGHDAGSENPVFVLFPASDTAIIGRYP